MVPAEFYWEESTSYLLNGKRLIQNQYSMDWNLLNHSWMNYILLKQKSFTTPPTMYLLYINTKWPVDWLVWFYGISTILGYSKPNPFYTYILNMISKHIF